tara:strand:- start:3508 stop:5631 length:2124 start_codon:yes stop_codon:yes gene_type:complete
MRITDGSADSKLMDYEVDDNGEGLSPEDDTDWLELSRSCYDNAVDYVQAAHRDDWERNLNLFNNEHPAGSKYNSDAFKRRSRLFRPKVRSYVRKNEAVTAQAFFSTNDVVNITPQNDNDPNQLASAGIMQELLNYRLQKTVPWFRLLVGARQTADIYGITAAKIFWHYAEAEDGEEVVADENGMPIINDKGDIDVQPRMTVVKDEPVIEPIEPENILFDPAADWLDPVGSSPYLIVRRPMFAIDVKQMMVDADPKTGQPAWKELDDATLQQGKEEDAADLDDARNMFDGPSRRDTDAPIDDYEVVFVHENFVKRGDQDYHYYTLATAAMLTDPTPVGEVYLHCKNGDRPVVVGYSNIEAFKPYPSSRVEMLGPLQQESNDLANLRMDALKFSLTPMVKVRRGNKALVPALMNRSPAKVITMDDPATDVIEMAPPPVNSQAYAEQDRINLDFDELAGNFNNSSIQSNRRMNETVGGMAMLSGQSNTLMEYDLRVFSESFVEPVLRQMVHLEQAYETDSVVLALAAEKADLFQKYGINQITDDLLQGELTVNVNVGIGGTDPLMQGRKFALAMQTFGQLVAPLVQLYGPNVLETSGVEAIASEIFGKAGYKDGQRFLNFKDGQGEDPRIQQLQAQLGQMGQIIQQLQGQVKDKNIDRQVKLAEAQMKGQMDAQKAQMDVEGKAALAEQGFKLDLARARLMPNASNVNVM